MALFSDIIPVSALAVGVGLGLSIFMAPYTSHRKRIKERLEFIRRIYADADETNRRVRLLADAFGHFDRAEKKMRCILQATAAICITTSILASILVLFASMRPSLPIMGCLVPASYLFFIVCYAGSAIVVRWASAVHFKSAEDCLERIVGSG